MKDRKAIITGAGQGIGRGIALTFASQNIHTILVGRTESKLWDVAREIEGLNGTSTVKALDITHQDAVADFASELATERIDILVNCAGDWLIETLDETGEDKLTHIIDINLKAPYRLSRLLLPGLRKSPNGSIINIGSMAAVGSYGGITAYTAAKTGLRGLTGSLADELNDELIRVVMVSPGPANTPMRHAATPDMDTNMLLEPDVIASLVSFIVNLPQGVTLDDVIMKSLLLKM